MTHLEHGQWTRDTLIRPYSAYPDVYFRLATAERLRQTGLLLRELEEFWGPGMIEATGRTLPRQEIQRCLKVWLSLDEVLAMSPVSPL